MLTVTCAGCGKPSRNIRCIGELVYCRRCARKVPPVATIRYVGTVECECGEQGIGVQVEFSELESACLCLDCLRTKMEEMADEPD